VDADLEDMLRVSNAVGADPRMVQGGGGNTSVKTRAEAAMFVKASGTGLADMREGSGYRLVDTAACAAIVEDPELAALPDTQREAEVLRRLMECCLDELHGRPSVETSLHAMLARCVVHTHPSVVNGLLCARDGRAALDRLFGDLDPPFLYIEFCGAGYALAARMHDELQQYRSRHRRLPEVVFLENHGLFVTTQDADRALQLTASVFDTVQAAADDAVRQAGLPAPVSPDATAERETVTHVASEARRFYSTLFGRTALVRYTSDETVREFLRLPDAPRLARTPPMSPDQVVYCRQGPVWVDAAGGPEAIAASVRQALGESEAGENTPLCILVAGLGLFCAAPSLKLLDAATAMMVAALETLSLASHFGGPRPLDDRWVEWMRDWEVERFRRHLVADTASDDDLADAVAVVTGAGSGLGKGIALDLVARGARVVLADVNADAAARAAVQANPGVTDGTGVPVWTDVTSEEAISDLFHEVICRFGGVDVLVNCAGIAPAHALVDFPLADWERTLRINLTGYFLAAREAARHMVRQGTGGSIINISSKSGLEASKNNSAYNATKAGEVHLARGWALELAEHGIRVNTVCPGNVFAGSAIWNEDYIRAVARKRGIEPEEVIPYYTSLTALKQEIAPADIAEAVAFLCSNRSSKITGQALVVDGGQVFVR
jgi:NAD(P)-dependent dehydrogenase (short-subunit alcohol dehydrogenase family)/rhamnose utilization protein RhaD (predicted bifunctional aldolase and dehydrogenase)